MQNKSRFLMWFTVLACLTGMAMAADVKFSWTPPAAQAGVIITKYNIYQVTIAGTESTMNAATYSTPVVSTGTTATSYTAIGVAPGVYFAKVSSFGTVNGTVKESILSNETTYVVPAAVIIMGVPVQQPPQVITN
jgi:hypothetical protein